LVPPHSERSLAGVRDSKERIELTDNRLKLQNDVRGTLLQAVAGALLLIGALATWRQVRLTQRQLELTQDQVRISERGQATERFTKAIDQLGSESIDVRLGGIYALQGLAEGPEPGYGVIARVLAAYVTTHAAWKAEDVPGSNETNVTNELAMLYSRAPDVQAAMTILAESIPSHIKSTVALRLMNTDLRRASLSGADLHNADFDGAHLEGAYLFHANFANAYFLDSHLEGAALRGADFTNARLGYASFRNALLEGANLAEAHKIETADFSGAKVDESTIWPQGFDWRAAIDRIEETTNPMDTT
jgi:hypothetical protein